MTGKELKRDCTNFPFTFVSVFCSRLILRTVSVSLFWVSVYLDYENLLVGDGLVNAFIGVLSTF